MSGLRTGHYCTALLGVIFLAGCTTAPPASLPRPPAPVAARAAAIPATATLHTVAYVRDGDTLYLDACGLVACVRLARLDCPELPTPAGIKARDYVRGLLPIGATVYAERLGRDVYGRNLCRLYLLDGRDLGALLLSSGLAKKE